MTMFTVDKRTRGCSLPTTDGGPFNLPGMIHGCPHALVVLASLWHSVSADDVEVGKLLKAKGIAVTESRGDVTAIAVSDGSKLTDEDFRQITLLRHLKMLSLSNCLNDERLSQLTALAELEYLQTNLAQITDDGIKPLGPAQESEEPEVLPPGQGVLGGRTRSPGRTAEPRTAHGRRLARI